jgi:hypothetical protein
MSELIKLQEKMQAKREIFGKKFLKQYLLAVGTLQAECKHRKTHWIQEIKSDGTFKVGLFKRCLRCGSTVDTYYPKPEFIENILNNFDREVEVQKRWENRPQ